MVLIVQQTMCNWLCFKYKFILFIVNFAGEKRNVHYCGVSVEEKTLLIVHQMKIGDRGHRCVNANRH